MPVHVPFSFIRTRQLAQTGTVVVEVDDPTNIDEIRRKLNAQEFVKFLVLDEEDDDNNWAFRPLVVSDPREHPPVAVPDLEVEDDEDT